jgi:hypothetical protein
MVTSTNKTMKEGKEKIYTSFKDEILKDFMSIYKHNSTITGI